MPVREYGIKATVKGVNKFLSDVNRINKRLNSTRKSVIELSKVYERAGVAMKRFADGSVKYINALSKAKEEIPTGEALKRLRAAQDELKMSAEQTAKASLGLGEKLQLALDVVTVFGEGVALAVAPLAVLGVVAVKTGKLVLSGLGVAVRTSAKVVKAGVDAMGKAFMALTAPVRNVVAAVREMFGRIGSIASGVLLRDIVFGAMRAFKEFAGSVQDAAGALQVLEARMRGVVASQAARVGYDFGDAMAFAQEKARGLVQWVERLAVTAPIKLESIANTVSLANAMDFAGEAGLRLSNAVITYTTGMGLSDEVTTRIIQNFAQMARAGKVTSTEVRDLTRGALLPLTEILERMRERTGYASESLEDFKKIAASGQVPVREFFNAFVDVVENDLPNALQIMGQTIEGAKTRLKNLFDVLIGGRVLGPVFAEIAKGISALVDKLSSEEAFKNASYIGAALVEAYKRVSAALAELGRVFASVIRGFAGGRSGVNTFVQALAYATAWIVAISRRFGEFVQRISQDAPQMFSALVAKAKAWGANIIGSLAAGMKQGAVYVIQALNYVAVIIRRLLEAHSPPKILPLLEKWGAAAMTSYIEGWKKADFSAFNEIAHTLASYIRSLPSLVDDQKTVILRILGTREQIAKAINSIRQVGSVAEGVIRKITRAAVDAPKGFGNYVRSLFSVEAAEYRLERAKERLAGASEVYDFWQSKVNETSSRYSKILADLNKQLSRNTAVYNENIRLREIDEAIATGLLTSEERKRLETEKNDILIKRQIRRVEDQRDAELATLNASLASAKARRDAAQAEVEAAQKRLDLAREQFDVAKAYIEFQTEQNNLLKEYLQLLKDAKKAFGGGGLSIQPPEIPPLDISGLPSPDDFDFDLSGIFDSAMKDVDTAISNIEAKFANLPQTLSGIIPPDVSNTLAELKDNLAGIAAELDMSDKTSKASRVWAAITAVWGAAASVVRTRVTPAYRDLKDEIGKLTGKSGGGALKGFLKVVIGSFLVVTSVVLAFAATALRAVSLVVRGFRRLKDGIGRIVRGIGNLILGIVKVVFGLLSGLVTTLLIVLVAPFAIFSERARDLLGNLGDTLAMFMTGFMDGLGNLKSGVVDIFVGMWDAVSGALDIAFSGIRAFAEEFVQSILDFFRNLSDELVGHSIIPDMMARITESFAGLDDVKERVGEFVSGVQEHFETLHAWIYEKVENIKGYWQGMMEKAEVLRAWIYDKVESIKEHWQNMMNKAEELRSWIYEKAENIKGYFEDMRKTADEKFTAIVDKFIELRGEVGTVKEKVGEFVSDWKDKFYEAKKEFVDTFFTPVHDKFVDLRSLIADVKEKISGFASSVSRSFSSIKGKIETVISSVWRLVDALKAIVIPEQLQSHSPPPFAVGLAEINKQISSLVDNLPGVSYGMRQISAPEIVVRSGGAPSITKTTKIEVNPTYSTVASEASVYYDVLAALGAAV